MKTIRQQLTRKLLLTLGLLFVLGGLGIYYCVRVALLAQFDAALRAKAQAIASVIEQKGDRLNIEFSDEYMRGFGKGGRDYYEFWRDGEQSVERSESLGDAHLERRHGTLNTPLFWNLTLAHGRDGRAIGLKFQPHFEEDKKNRSAPIEVILEVASKRRNLAETLL